MQNVLPSDCKVQCKQQPSQWTVDAVTRAVKVALQQQVLGSRLDGKPTVSWLQPRTSSRDVEEWERLLFRT